MSSPFMETELKVEPSSGATIDQVLDEMCRIEEGMERLGYDLTSFVFLLNWCGREVRIRGVRIGRAQYREHLLKRAG